MSKLQRTIIIVLISVFCIWALYPTLSWYFWLSPQDKDLSIASRLEIRSQVATATTEDISTIRDMLIEKAEDTFAQDLIVNRGYNALFQEAQTRRKNKGTAPLLEAAKVQDVLGEYKSQQDAYQVLSDHYRTEAQTLKQRKNSIINLGLDLSGGVRVVLAVDTVDLEERLGHAPSNNELSEALDLAIEILNNRIDRFGVTEPQIRKQNENNILIEIPGDNDQERVNGFLLGKGSLNLQVVNEEATEQLLTFQQENTAWTLEEDNTPDFIEAGTVVSEYVTKDAFGIDTHRRWIALYEDIDTYGLDGQYITDAATVTDPLSNRPVVSLTLNSDGAQKFAKLTRDNINKSLAIVMDDKVRAYAVMSVEISDGRASISGFDREESRDIAKVLKTAALPVTLDIVNMDVVGPTLSQEAINVGIRTVLFGLALVAVFMILYYKGAGIIAVIVLAFNLFFLISVLSAFNLTLTLTGIAGIILTVGMAVDANVLIYERIKEEYRIGKGRSTSIHAGFQKAFWTIVDANITTFIAAFFIAQIASGPIQGFAVTLSVGIAATLFSSLFISRLLFDIGTDLLKKRRISIAWR